MESAQCREYWRSLVNVILDLSDYIIHCRVNRLQLKGIRRARNTWNQNSKDIFGHKRDKNSEYKNV